MSEKDNKNNSENKVYKSEGAIMNSSDSVIKVSPADSPIKISSSETSSIKKPDKK